MIVSLLIDKNYEIENTEKKPRVFLCESIHSQFEWSCSTSEIEDLFGIFALFGFIVFNLELVSVRISSASAFTHVIRLLLRFFCVYHV